MTEHQLCKEAQQEIFNMIEGYVIVLDSKTESVQFEKFFQFDKEFLSQVCTGTDQSIFASQVKFVY